LKLIGGVVDFNLRYGRDEAEEIRRCKICGEPTSGEVCTVCKLRMRLLARLNATAP
jgi:tRNA(Ile)-lysidine synthase TilS/MesJ